MTYNRGNASAQVNANRNMDEEARRRAAEEAARKAEEERKRKEAEAKAKAEQEAAQRAAQEAAEAQNQQDNAPSTQNPGTSVMNFKPTAAQRHEIQTNTAWNRAEKKLVEAAPLDLLPPEMEDQREELEKKNQAGQLGSAWLEKYSSGDNQYSVDATQFGNVKELAYFCSGLSNDADRVKLYKRYADENGLDLEDLYYQAETMLGGKAFNYPQSARGQMEAIGVYDVSGNELDLGTATAAQVKQAIRMTPPGDDHDALLKAYRRLYGDWGTDDSEFDFLDSADLTESDYKKAVKEFESSFTFSEGHTQENQEAYLNALDDIYSNYENPRVQQQMIRQLNRAYADRTGMQAMSEDELLALAKENGYIGTDDVDEDGEKKGFFKGLWDAAQDVVSKAFGEKPEAPRHIPEVEEVTTSAAAAQGGGGASGGGYSGGGSASGYAAMAQAPAKNTAEEAAAQTAAIAQAEDNPEVQGPVYRPQESATNKGGAAVGGNAQYISSVPYNADMTDSEALALWRKGEKLDERNMSQIGWLTDNANVMGLVGNMGMYANMGQTPSGGRNVVAKDVKYGNRLGTAAMVIGNGSLPEDIENETILTLGNVVDQIDRLVSDPRSGISIPKGMNQYDYVLSLPQYAHLAEQVDATTGVMADVHAAYAQQAQLEKEAHDKHIETIKAKMLAGEGTPQMAQELAQVYGTEYVDLGDDETRAMYRFQMSEKSTFFTNDGTFWQNGSAAAQEGMNLMRMGGGKNGETFSTYKATLKNETLNLIDDYTTAAKQMGMTLAEYLDSAGISGIDQLVGIAYNDMISRGNAYSKDAEAQAAAQTFVDSDIGAWDAVGMGAQHGIESYGADFMQTTYMTIDAADYSTAVIDLQNEYTSKYGVDMAAAMYRSDLLAYIDSGAMSEESAADLLDHMKRARSIFDVAYELDPGFLEGLARSGYEKLQKDVEGLEASAAHLPPELRTVFNTVSGGVYSLTGMGAATVFGGLTGSAAAGSALAWGGTEWSSAYDANRAKGMSPGMAGLAALGNAGIAAAVNMGGTGTDMDVWWKGSALPEFTKAMKGKNAATMLKDMAALTGKYAVKRGVEEAGEEVSETLFGTAFDLTDNAMLAIDRGKPVTPSVLLRSIGDAVRETDFDALGKELLTSAGMGFTMGGIFSLGGSAKTMLAAKKGINMRSRYASIDLAAQMAEGNVPFTEENIGKVYAAVQKDLLDARFRKYIDSNHSAAIEQKATVAAAMMGSAEQTRTTAVENAQKAQEYEAKAEAAREASKTASGRWWELRDRLAGGDLSVEVEMESARMQWQKAETTLQENENAAGKAMEKAQEAMTAWLRECRAQAGQIKSWMLQEQADQIASMRLAAAEELARRYEAEEAERNALTTNLVRGDAQTQEQLALNMARIGADIQTAKNVAAVDDGRTYAENALFTENDFEENAEVDNRDIDSMTDEELDNEFASLATQIGDAERRIADITAQNAELGLDSDTIQAINDQELSPLSQRRDSLITRETNRFNDLFDRMQQAIEMDNEEAADQLQTEYDSVMARLERMGVNTEALVMAQYGVTPEAVAEGEATAQAEAENAEQERLTESLSRRMEHTAMEIERIQPARKYFMNTKLYVNASQKAEILSAEGLKSLSNVNRKYGLKLTDKEAAGAMPLDGHVLSDIAAESAGVVNESANPVEEMLRIMQTGKKLAEDQRTEKDEARELSKKKKAADKRRKSSVDAVVGVDDDVRAYRAITGDDTASKLDLKENMRKRGYANERKDLQEALRSWDGKDKTLEFVVGKTGKTLHDLGLTDSEVVLSSEKLVKIRKDHPAMTDDVIAKIPDIVENPVVVMKSKTVNGRLTMFGEVMDADGDPVLAIVSIEPKENYVTGAKFIRLNSAYGKNQNPQKLIDSSEILYIDKNRAADWMASTRLQLPVGTTQESGSSTSIVSQRKNDVNKNIDALATNGLQSTPAQAAQQLSKKGKKLESNALRAVQDLADTVGIGFRIKSDARFNSADARMNSNVLGYYKNGQRNAIVRSKEAGKLEVSGHEVGHAIQEQLGIHSTQTMIDSWQKNFGNTGAYSPQQYDHEAFAEFFWRYLKGRDVAVAYADEASVDAFEYAMRKNKKLFKAVQKAQTQVSNYFNADTGAMIQTNISSMADANKETPFYKKAMGAIVDDTAAAEPMQDVIRQRIGEGHLPYDLNLRDTIRYNRRASARAAQCIAEAMVDNDGNVVGESLTDVFREIKGKDYDLYMQWWLARHSLDRDTRKGEKNQVFSESDISTAERTKFIADTELAHPEFARTNERFQKWRRLFLETYLVNNGLMGEPARAEALLDMLDTVYPYYAPTKRTGKGGTATKIARGVTGQKTYAMHEATGSTETIIDPFESFVGMVNSVVSLAAENDNRKKFAQLYDAFSGADPGNPGAGMGLFANEITQDIQKNVVDVKKMREKIEKMLDDVGTDPDVIMQISDLIGDEKVEYHGKGRVDMNSVIRVRGEDGKDRYFEIYNPQLFELLATVSGQAGKHENSLLKMFSNATRAMSMLTTGSNPVFGITNALRDFQNSVNYGSWATGYIDGAVKWLATLGDVIANSDVSKEYDALGGGGWSQYDTRTKKGAEATRSTVFKGYNTRNVGQFGKMIGRTLWRVATMEDLNGAIEKTSRLVEYKYGKHDLGTAEGRIEAFLAAQDVTTDFARHGNSQLARDLKYLIPFFNASMQGVYRNARQFTAQESDRAKIRLAKQITNTALASLLANALLMEFLDDEEKEEFTYLSQDLTTKHMFIPNFDPDTFGDAMLIRIPLDQNPISYAINAAVSNMVWKGETGDEFLISMAALADVIKDNLNLASSTILDPVLAVRSNKNWYGSNIVPTYLQSYDALNQYTEETPEAFVTGAKLLNTVTGKKVSPMMIQYMAEQYTGYIGQTVIPALPSEKNQDGFISGWFNALAATARKRITSDPLKSNDVVSTVYDSFNEMSAVSKAGKSKRDFEIDYLKPSLNDREKRRAVNEAYDLTHSGGELYEAKKEISALYDEIDEINARDDMTDRQKYLLTSEVRKEMVEIALDAQEVMQDYDARYRYDDILPRMFAEMLNK